MNRTEAISKLQGMSSALRAKGATSLYLFGSTARGEDHAASDLDLFLDYDPRSSFSALDLVSAREMLQDQLGIDIDLTTRNGLHPLIRARVEAEAIRIF